MPARFSRPLDVQPLVHHGTVEGDFGGFLSRLLQLGLLFGREHCLLPHIDESSSIHRTGFYPPVAILRFVFLPF